MFAIKAPLSRQITTKAKRKLRAREGSRPSVYFGLGMFGLVGWSVALPTLLAIALGLWLDRRWPSPYSWTLMLLVVGVALGCANAWRWIKRSQVDESASGNEEGHS